MILNFILGNKANCWYIWRKSGEFEVLYMEDTPMLVDYVSQIGVLLVIIDEMIIPGKLLKPVLENIFHGQYKVIFTSHWHLY